VASASGRRRVSRLAQPHDSGYQAAVLATPRWCRFAAGFIAEDWVEELDSPRLEKQSGSYVSDDLRPRADDVVWRCAGATAWLYVYLLLEFQSAVDPFMGGCGCCVRGLLYQI